MRAIVILCGCPQELDKESLLVKTLHIFLIVSWIYKLWGSGASIFSNFVLESYFVGTCWETVNPLLHETIQIPVRS